MEAAEITSVLATSNAYDKRTDKSTGCPPFGCMAENTRDTDLGDRSRWSCNEDLAGEPCSLCYAFGDPVDIVEINVAMLKGDERVLSFAAVATNSGGDITDSIELSSSGSTSEFESYGLGTSGTVSLCLTSTGMDSDDWFSITEVS